jgi:hypothetical protein
MSITLKHCNFRNLICGIVYARFQTMSVFNFPPSSVDEQFLVTDNLHTVYLPNCIFVEIGQHGLPFDTNA